MSVHRVESTQDTIRSGHLDPGAPAAAVVDSGDLVQYPNTWTHWGNEAKFGMTFADREPLRHRYPDGPYAMVGPVEVNGSDVGDIVECRLESLRTIDWGWNSFPLGVGALPSDFTEPYVHYFRFDEQRTTVEFIDGIRLPIRPLLGVVAVEPSGTEKVSAILSGPYGGNLVLRDYTVGSSLFLPVQKAGARIWIGDVHAAEGDGVVDQTGIETAAELVELRVYLHRGVALRAPLVETPDSWILIGFGESLDDALVSCLREVIHWVALSAAISESDAYALASMAVSFRVTQYAHQTASAYSSIPPKAVHGVVPKTIFSAALRDRIDAWLRPSAG